MEWTSMSEARGPEQAMQSQGERPLGRDEFESQLRGMERYYHTHHEFQQRMDAGELDRPAIQGWVANRFYYQINIPLKDAAILANCPDREVRRRWVQRVLDHDGYDGAEGRHRGMAPTRRGGRAEARRCARRRAPAPGGPLRGGRVRELRAPGDLAGRGDVLVDRALRSDPRISGRLDNWPQHYPWIDPDGYTYFRQRLTEARRDVEHGPVHHARALPDPGGPGERDPNPEVQARRPLDDARRHVAGLCRGPATLPWRTGLARAPAARGPSASSPGP